MGCTPSIRVSQAGVVYCGDSEESASPGAASAYSPDTLYYLRYGHVVRTEIRPDRSVTSGKGSGKDPDGGEAETDGRRGKNTGNVIMFGPLRLKTPTLSVLLVFAKDDAQLEAFRTAANRLGYHCTIARSTDLALEHYKEMHHDLIIIDHRHSKHFDAEFLCRCIRETKFSDQTVIVAVTKRYEKDEPSIVPLLNCGFNKRIIENSNIGSCCNELLSLELGDVISQQRLKACHGLFTALENASDAIEITNDNCEIQYVNRSYEQLSGYTREEILGKDARELSNERNKPEALEAIYSQLQKEKYWEGAFYLRRKSGSSVCHHCHIAPVLGPEGKVYQYVSVKKTLNDSHFLERFRDSEITPTQLANGAVPGVVRKRDSLTKSLLVEAPITKVISIINAAQENCPITVVQALDTVLDILRTSELYSPYFSLQMKDEDQMTSNLVGGLISQGMKRQISPNFDIKTVNHPHINIPSSSLSVLSSVPENIQKILATDKSWDFQIFDLEVATCKRPLAYLGLKILSKFKVREFLQISESCLMKWLQVVEANYHTKNSYHNSTHAADVLQATAYFLEREQIKNIFDEVDIVACLLAAIVHDVDHPGRSNAFLINARSELAILYNDQAVLENHHASLTFQLTAKDDSVNIFKNLEREAFYCLRHMFIDMVLATEMSKHFEHVSKFLTFINSSKLKPTECSSRTEQVSVQIQDIPVSTYSISPENHALIRRILIKCADISNPTRSLLLCKEWARRIAEEYCSQTDEEKVKGLPVVMPVFDRKSFSLSKSQTSFIDFFINDMFESWNEFCSIPEPMSYLCSNYLYWKEHMDQPMQSYQYQNDQEDQLIQSNSQMMSKVLENEKSEETQT